MLAKRIKILESIDPKSWEHPADKAALSALRQLKGFDELVRTLISKTTERSLYLMHLASSVKVTGTQYPMVSNLMNEIIETFDWDYRPNVFISQSPFFNAHTFGVDEPFIVLNSSLLSLMTEEELKVVLAHEMGHVMSGHALYKTVSWLIANISLSFIPLGEIIMLPIKMALAEWDRKSELTADRAALLGTQSEMPNYNVLMRMSGGNDLTQVNINDFFVQALEYEEKKTMLDSVHKMLNQLWLSHPYPVARLQEIKTWASSGYYSSILEGHYINRKYHEEDAKEDIKEGFNYYKETMENSDDPITKFASNLSSGIGKFSEEVGDYFKRRNEN